MFATDTGRERFWAEKSTEQDGRIEFQFIDGLTLKSKILQNEPPKRFVFEYFGGRKVTVDISDDRAGGTDLTFRAEAVRSVEEWPGWGFVLITIKTTADYNIDIRNHDIKGKWGQGY